MCRARNRARREARRAAFDASRAGADRPGRATGAAGSAVVRIRREVGAEAIRARIAGIRCPRRAAARAARTALASGACGAAVATVIRIAGEVRAVSGTGHRTCGEAARAGLGATRCSAHRSVRADRPAGSAVAVVGREICAECIQSCVAQIRAHGRASAASTLTCLARRAHMPACAAVLRIRQERRAVAVRPGIACVRRSTWASAAAVGAILTCRAYVPTRTAIVRRKR